MRSIAVASGKGGVGKTSVAVNLSAGAAAAGDRVLLVDLDHGAHATTWLLGGRCELGIAEAMLDGDLLGEHRWIVNGRSRLELAPSSPGLQTIEGQLANTFAREMILRDVVRAHRKRFDLVVYDCPPGVGFLTQSAIYASDAVLVPVLPGFMAIDGLVDIRKLVNQMRTRGRARVDIAGAVLFAADDREALTEATRASVRKLGSAPLFKSEVRVSTAGKQLTGRQAVAFDPGADERGADDYRALLKETKARLPAGR